MHVRRKFVFVLVATSLGVAACAAVDTEQAIRGSQCGPTLDFEPINQHSGKFAHAQAREGAVVLVNGSCTGTLIEAAAGPVVLTAGHCVAVGDQALVAFNVEAEPDGDDSFITGRVIESALEPDYALILPDALPDVTPTPLGLRTSQELAIIQHPRGLPKVIAEGTFLEQSSGLLRYIDLDTEVGSSGAGILNFQGRLLGIHTDGDCTETGGSNSGWSTVSIVEASNHLEPLDVDDC